MRTVNATLLAALAAGNGRPIVRATIGKMDGTVIHTGEVLSYKLTARQLEFEMKYTGDFGGFSGQTAIWLERGVTLNGTDYTVTSGRFYIWSQTYLPNGRQRTVGGIFPKQYYFANGDDTYQNVITAICTAFGKTAVFRDPAAAWLAYQFLPLGKLVIVNDANNFFNLLRQKYLIFACDNGSEEILFFALDAAAFGAADAAVTATADFELQTSQLKNRQYLWRDELEAVHTAGSATDPIHNLGYLESTDSPPARMTPTYLMSAITRPRLDILDGDTVSLVTYIVSAKMYAQVTEQYGQTKDPRWMTLIEANPIFENTEGGALPSTIERVSNYTPLNTSMFNGILSSSDNNLQAAMDTLDDRALPIATNGSISIGMTLGINDDSVATFQVDANKYYLVFVQIRAGSTTTNWVLAGAKGVATSVCVAYITGSNVNVTTGILTGTTGVDGKTTVSVHTDGKIYVENRTGTARNYTVKVW